MTKETVWPQIVFQTSPAQAEELEAALFACGALSVMYQDEHDQPILEPGPGEVRLWDAIRLVGLFAVDTALDSVVAELQNQLGASMPEHTRLDLPDQAWERVWMEDFKPIQFGPSLWVCPTHCDPVDSDATNLRLDPGLAFGTGSHATTAQCLDWLGTHDIAGQHVLDYGCGSGILTVAAALLGAKSVVAVDIDPQAITATTDNAVLNGVLSSIEVGLPSLAEGRSADTVLANILFQPLMELAPLLAANTKPGGNLVLSGILQEQVAEVSLRYTQYFRFQEPRQRDDWALLHAIRLPT